MKVTMNSQSAIQPVVQAEPQGRQLQTAADRREDARQDSVALSRQALEHIRQKQAERAAAQKEKLAQSTDVISMIRESNQQADAQAEGFAVISRCLKIASNLMDGDRIPPKDLQYLMEHDAKLFQLAMSMRKTKEDPEDSEAVVKDEEKRADGSADTLAPSPSSAPVSGGAAAEPVADGAGGEAAE